MMVRERARAARIFGWAGAALFLASLLFTFYEYETAMGRPGASHPTAAPILSDIALFTVFALHHSVFARERVRARVQQIVDPALERSVYVWLASLMLIGVCIAWQPVQGVLWRVAGIPAWILRIIQIGGVILAIRSAAVIDVFELAGVRQLQAPVASGSPGPSDVEGSRKPQEIEFKTSGPYGYVRHPIYSGWFLMVFAEPTMTATRATFAIVSCVYLLVAIPFEERSLRATTSGAYASYIARVRWRLVPYLY